MVRLTTVASLLGLATGLWSTAGMYLEYLGRSACLGVWYLVGQEGCMNNPTVNLLTQAFAVGLVLVSVVSFVGPRRIYNASSVLSGAVFVGVLLSSWLSFAVIASLVLIGATVVASVFAAWREPRVSEQSHPMNLPVFG